MVTACGDDGLPLPELGAQSSTDVVCRDCLTPKVQDLRRGLMPNIERFFDCLEKLKNEIGYTAICTECLYEKTGIDLRRRTS